MGILKAIFGSSEQEPESEYQTAMEQHLASNPYTAKNGEVSTPANTHFSALPDSDNDVAFCTVVGGKTVYTVGEAKAALAELENRSR